MFAPKHGIGGADKFTCKKAGCEIATVVDAVQLFPSVAVTVYTCAINPVKVPEGVCVAAGIIP